MGTLLSFLAYAERPQNIVGIVAIASPLVVRVRRRAVRNLLRAGLSRQLSPDDPGGQRSAGFERSARPGTGLRGMAAEACRPLQADSPDTQGAEGGLVPTS